MNIYLRNILLVALALAMACGDDTVDLGDADPTGDVSVDTSPADADPDDATPDADLPDAEVTPDAMPDATPDATPDAEVPMLSLLAINEIRASGDDWIELHYRGTGTLSLGGLKVTDQDDDGMPRIDRAVTIPAGVELATGEYFIILADQDNTSTMLETECQLEGVTQCVFSDWGMSAGNGDTVFVLNDLDEVVISESYPADAIGDVEDATWARDVDGDGVFVVSVPTPNASNMPL